MLEEAACAEVGNPPQVKCGAGQKERIPVSMAEDPKR
jgi:hypothetical protein